MGQISVGQRRSRGWVRGTVSKTKLAAQVEETLKLNVDSSYEEIRAAASVLLFLGRNYVWPVEDLDRHALAADRLEEGSRAPDIVQSPELVEEIRAEIQELRSRINSPGTQSPPATPKKWWQFWK